MIHYHGTPITPVAALYKLAGRHFCVSHAAPQDVARCHAIGQSVMLDNGAYSKWRNRLRKLELTVKVIDGEVILGDGEMIVDWTPYYAWADKWLGYPSTWAVIPDVIDGGSQMQDALVREWPFGHRGAPVWHMDEPMHRLLKLCGEWPRVCIGSTAEYAVVLSDPWKRRMDECWNALAAEHRHLPNVHMLRGMQLSGREWPFASVDSTDVAQNHNRTREKEAPLLGEAKGLTDPLRMAERWDAMQTPGTWVRRSEQMELVA